MGAGRPGCPPAGLRIVDTAGPLRPPELGSATTPSWHGENELIDEANPTFDEIALLTSTMESVKTLTHFSNELARQSVIAPAAALNEGLVKDVADTLDARSSGPRLATASSSHEACSPTRARPCPGCALSLDDLLDTEALALGANVNTDSLKRVRISRELIALRRIKQGNGSNAYVLEPDPTKAGGYTILGKRVIVTKRLR